MYTLYYWEREDYLCIWEDNLTETEAKELAEYLEDVEGYNTIIA